MKPVDHVKWVIITFLSVSTFLNYVDRQALALLARPVQAALGMDDQGYALVVTLFLIAYTIGNLVSGWVVDRLGPHRALTVFVVWWSLAAICGGLVRTTGQMGAVRFALGLGEVGNFIAAPALVGLLFPARQRAIAIGIYTAAAMFGAVASPPLITSIDAIWGWRPSFILMGVVGLFWGFAWHMQGWRIPLSAPPDHAGADRTEESAEIATWLDAVRSPKVWGVILGVMLTYPVWHFYLNWFPKYLTDERGLSTLQMGRSAWIVYLAAGLGSLSGGMVSGWLASRGRTSRTAKLWVMGAVCVAVPIGSFNAFEPPVPVSLALAGAMAFFHMYWQVNMTALPTDLFTAGSLGKVYAVSGVAAGLGGVGTTWAIGQMVETVSYRPMFVIISCAYPLALSLVLVLTSKKTAPVALEE